MIFGGINQVNLLNYSIKRKYRIGIVGVWTLQSILRMFFYTIYLSGRIEEFLTNSISPEKLQYIMTVFLLLGCIGLLSVVGLIFKKNWGYHLTALILVTTIIFDLWAYRIQNSAILGLILPFFSIILFYLGSKPGNEYNKIGKLS
jgi:uncharacterized membrane protein